MVESLTSMELRWLCLIAAEDFDFNEDEFGVNNNQTATFSFLRQSFIDAEMVLEIGDLISWNYIL